MSATARSAARRARRPARAATKPAGRSASATARRTKRHCELSHDAIRHAALRLIDREGLDALSMRKLGRALGCEGMAVYWYYPSKDALLDGVVDLLVQSLADAIRPDATDWVATLRAVAAAYRRLAHAHPHAFPLLATRRFASEGTYAFLERLFELAAAQGIDDATIARFYRGVSSYCNGFALNELASAAMPKDAAKRALREKFARVHAVSEWLEAEHLDELFEFGLELQLEALARATERSSRPK